MSSKSLPKSEEIALFYRDLKPEELAQCRNYKVLVSARKIKPVARMKIEVVDDNPDGLK